MSLGDDFAEFVLSPFYHSDSAPQGMRRLCVHLIRGYSLIQRRGARARELGVTRLANGLNEELA